MNAPAEFVQPGRASVRTVLGSALAATGLEPNRDGLPWEQSVSYTHLTLPTNREV